MQLKFFVACFFELTNPPLVSTDPDFHDDEHRCHRPLLLSSTWWMLWGRQAAEASHCLKPWPNGRNGNENIKIPPTQTSVIQWWTSISLKNKKIKFLPRKEIWQKKMTSLKHTHIKFAGDVGQFFRNLQTSIHQFELWSFRWNNDQSMDEKNDGSQYINLKKVIPSRSLT